MRIPTHRPPTHPGEMLLEEFLTPLAMTQRDLADSIQVPYPQINALTNCRRSMTPGTALRLDKYFGTSAGFAPASPCRHKFGVRRILAALDGGGTAFLGWFDVQKPKRLGRDPKWR